MAGPGRKDGHPRSLAQRAVLSIFGFPITLTGRQVTGGPYPLGAARKNGGSRAYTEETAGRF